jgi:predicted Rossmann-fold nucleotide-binding protein
LLLSFLDNAVSKGFIKREHRETLLVSSEPEDLLDRFTSYRAPNVEKWAAVKTRP